MTPESWIERGLEHAARAMAIEPDAPTARELRGALHFLPTLIARLGSRDSLLRSAERDLRFVVEADPSRARAWYLLSQLLQDRGNFAEAYVAAERALEADAYLLEARRVISGLLFTALDLERYDDARRWCRTGLRRHPDDPRLADCELVVLGWAGRGAEDVARAWSELRAAELRDSASYLSSTWAYRRMAVAAVLARTGLRDSALAVMERTRAALPDERTRNGMLVDEAHVRVLLDDAEGALAALGSYLESNPQWRDYVAKIPWFRALWGDRRFQRLVAPDGDGAAP